MNWTKIGLKLFILCHCIKGRQRLNWTKIGLKPRGPVSHGSHLEDGLNWTKIGLKPTRERSSRMITPV